MTLAIAHRGEPVGHRENTLRAFEAAAAAGADMVELDCRLTRDGEVVVVHDPTLERLWGLGARVADLDHAEVSALGSGDVRIPTLAEAFASVSLPVMVDVDDPVVMEHALRVTERAGAFERSLFAGALDGLTWLRQARADARIALSWDRTELPAPDLLADLRPELFNPNVACLGENTVAVMREAGIGVSVWTVDDEQLMGQVVDRSVDAVITNRIGALVALLGRHRGGDANQGAA